MSVAVCLCTHLRAGSCWCRPSVRRCSFPSAGHTGTDRGRGTAGCSPVRRILPDKLQPETDLITIEAVEKLQVCLDITDWVFSGFLMVIAAFHHIPECIITTTSTGSVQNAGSYGRTERQHSGVKTKRPVQV